MDCVREGTAHAGGDGGEDSVQVGNQGWLCRRSRLQAPWMPTIPAYVSSSSPAEAFARETGCPVDLAEPAGLPLAGKKI